MGSPSVEGPDVLKLGPEMQVWTSGVSLLPLFRKPGVLLPEGAADLGMGPSTSEPSIGFNGVGRGERPRS